MTLPAVLPCDDAVFQRAAGQGRDWIAARVPHQGRMCLLDGVLLTDTSESDATVARIIVATLPLGATRVISAGIST